MDISIGLIFGTLNAAEKIAGYLGIVETLNGNITQLKNSYLTSGIRALKQAQASESEFEFLLREARSRFNQAIDLEKEEKLITAYLGLALCHHGLGDKNNCHLSLRAIEDIELDYNIALLTIDLTMNPIGFVLRQTLQATKVIPDHRIIRDRREKIDCIKKSVRSYLNENSF
ncbi:MAG: hypothetical protein AAGE84_28290 [Cyanobacteria bacterium P01_G01_bin.39]